MPRGEYVAWCKQRALAETDPANMRHFIEGFN